MLKIFVFIYIWFVKQDIQKWLKTKICSFLWRIWKWKEKRTKNFDLPEQGLEPQIFSNFSAHDLNFHGNKEPKIKSKQASKRDRTLLLNASIISGLSWSKCWGKHGIPVSNYYEINYKYFWNQEKETPRRSDSHCSLKNIALLLTPH